MEEKRTINVDYISIVRQEGNLVKLEHIDIRKPESLLSDLKAILEDPERTLLDLQSRMCEFYEEDKRRNISYLHHSDYTNAHTTGYVSFPKIYHQDEYNDMMDELSQLETDAFNTSEGSDSYPSNESYTLYTEHGWLWDMFCLVLR